MFSLKTAPSPIRAILALAALLLALRVLSPAGFMPAFDHGAVTINEVVRLGSVAGIAATGWTAAGQSHCRYGRTFAHRTRTNATD
jgi:hypothetical protein